jgi:hypothetical protein
MIWTGIIIITLSFADCLAPDSPESEPEPAPVESEEIDSIEPDEIEEVKAIVTIDAESTLAIRKSAGTKDKPENDIIDRVPEGRMLKVINKHGNTLIKDGYTWWEVEDTVTGISGWSAADFLEEKK